VRGNKVCPKCNGNNGPRAFACKHCGEPFVLKGVVATAEQIEQARLRKLGIDPNKVPEVEEEYLNIHDFFQEVEPTDREIKNGGERVECYMSFDNKFRLRHAEEFMGIPLEKLHDRWYTLLHRNDDRDSHVRWDLVKRFKSLNSVLLYVRAVQRGERELVIYRPGDDVRKNRALVRHQKKMKKIKKVR